MEFVCYTDWAQLPESANRLFDEGARTSIFLSRPWFENLESTVLKADQSLLLACVINADDVLAILPLVMQDGLHLGGWTHLYSSLHGLMLEAKARRTVVECLVRGLDEMSIGSLRLDPVAEDDGNLHLLQECMQSVGYQCHRRFRFYNWIYRVQGQSFESYMQGRPSRVRNTIARKQRKLQRELGYDIRLYVDSDIERGLSDYRTVYRNSWKVNEQYDEFVEGLAKKLSSQGWLRLAVLYCENEPVAAQFWFVVHGKASIFKLVYDEAWKKYSPGSILIRYLMEHVIDVDLVDEIDFLTGNDAYKQDWMSERRERWAYTFFKTEPPRPGTPRVFGSIKKYFKSN